MMHDAQHIFIDNNAVIRSYTVDWNDAAIAMAIVGVIARNNMKWRKLL